MLTSIPQCIILEFPDTHTVNKILTWPVKKLHCGNVVSCVHHFHMVRLAHIWTIHGDLRFNSPIYSFYWLQQQTLNSYCEAIHMTDLRGLVLCCHQNLRLTCIIHCSGFQAVMWMVIICYTFCTGFVELCPIRPIHWPLFVLHIQKTPMYMSKILEIP